MTPDELRVLVFEKGPDEAVAIIREHERRAHAAGVVTALRWTAWEAAELSANYRIMASTVDGAAIAARLAANIANWAREIADELEAQKGEQGAKSEGR